MAKKFTVIPSNTFEGLQLDAGVLLRTFDPTTGAAPRDEDIICATTGGIQATCVPTYSDLGEDVDNCPVNMLELKNLDSYECTLGFTSLGMSPEAIKLALGAADVNGSAIIPRRDLATTDFHDVWWVGDKADGGFVAVCLKNALSTGGFSLQTSKAGKGQLAVTLTGHVSINAQNEMPMVFYSTTGTAPVTPTVEFAKHSITLAPSATEKVNVTTIPSGATVTYTTGNAKVATVASDGTITAVGAGDTIITASIAVADVEYTDTCTVVVEETGA